MTAKMLTIIVPAFNEEKNLPPLVERIDCSLKRAGIAYSIIIVDDRSTDNTVAVVQELAKHYPVSLLRKKSDIPRGKASSLLAGFSFAQADIVAMIDADLQYPPEAIPEMVKRLEEGADVVVGRRKNRHIGFVRDAASYLFRSVFGSFLFGLDYDIQSGLKVFRKEVIDRARLSPSAWMFDLEFLLQARDASYTIVSHDIEFHKRASGEAKIHMIQASIDMAIQSVKLKFSDHPTIAFHEKQKIHKGDGFHYQGREYVSFTNLHHKEMALTQMTKKQKAIVWGMIVGCILSFAINWKASLISVVAVLTCLYFLDLLFTIFLVIKSFSADRGFLVSDEEMMGKDDGYWPSYTVFCPLYKEWRVIPQFVKAMRQMEYPKEKLQVMLILEEDDKETRERVEKMELPSFFEVKVVPHSKPKTKPKALNYGMQFARGEYAVVYDAEDIPDPLQLKKTVISFEKSEPNVVCMQSKLSFYNPRQNILTRLFTAEYSLWFDLVLPGLQAVNAPIPLGGTSNHFRVRDLHKLKGWDPFNVTEDCDLGMRLVKLGYKTAIVDSTTMEEANSEFVNWYGQRSRWIKGYIQTYLVHMRDVGKFSRTLKKPDAFTFQLIVGGKILSMMINPFMWVITISYFAFRSTLGPVIESFYPTPILYLGVLCLVAGNFLYSYSYMIGCLKRGYFELIKFALITPLYWLCMSAASWRALGEIVINPHYWRKTNHGLHLGLHKNKKHKDVQGFDHVLVSYGSKEKERDVYLPKYCDILGSSQFS